MKQKTTHAYDDIIHLPHHVSPKRPGMSMTDRAAQFSPFAALTGYESVIQESGRLTDTVVELTDSGLQQINEKLGILAEHAHVTPQVTVTYFEPDRYKSGGTYVTVTGSVKRVDTYDQSLVLTDGREIPMEAIYDLRCGLFPE